MTKAHPHRIVALPYLTFGVGMQVVTPAQRRGRISSAMWQTTVGRSAAWSRNFYDARLHNTEI